jgi:crossover junction endodeoxyribonuclease RuvC
VTDLSPPAADALRVLGIDPGLADVGWGLVDLPTERGAPRLVDYGVIRTAATLPLAERLLAIHDRLRAIVEAARPSVVVVEQLFFCSNVKTAMVVAHGRAACILATAPGRRLVEYTPLQIKKALTGSGGAAKMQVQLMVRALLGLKEIPKPDHAADALGAALCYLQSLALDGRLAAAAIEPVSAEGKEKGDPDPRKVLLALRRGAGRRRR